MLRQPAVEHPEVALEKLTEREALVVAAMGIRLVAD